MTSGDDLVLQFTPALVAILLNAERTKGDRLTEDEVVEIRDQSVCVCVTRSMADAVTANRGYDDLDPERCWEQWQVVREQFED